MSELQLRELRLTAFKSYRDVTIPVSPLTIMIGRNGSGKSNALDALELLGRLAAGDEVRDAIDGNRKDQSAIRGGAEGCAPYGGDRFTIGVSVGDAQDKTSATAWADLDVTVQVRPDVRIIAEHFRAWLPGLERWADVLTSLEPSPDRSDLFAIVFNGKRGRDPQLAFRSTRLLTGQIPLRFGGETPAERDVLDTVETALGTIAGVFHLDPVPHLMRDYVPEQDSILKRTGANLSAAVAAMRRDDARYSQLIDIVRGLPENKIRGLDVVKGGFGDIMLALREKRGRGSEKIPARQMSDGMLRMLAIATALLSGGGGLDVERRDEDRAVPLCLVLEELENGLHPSQVARVLDLVRAASHERHFQVVLTTHSPALLNALGGNDHTGVLVCERDRSGASSIRRLVDLPGYLGMMAEGLLGDSVTSGRIAKAGETSAAPDLRSLLGIG